MTANRIIALRLHAASLYKGLMGEWEPSLELAEEGVEVLLEDYQGSAQTGLNHWDSIQFLKLFMAEAEARASLEKYPVLNDKALGLIGQFTTSVYQNWLDLIPDESMASWNENFAMHAIVRMLTLASGRPLPQPTLETAHDEQPGEPLIEAKNPGMAILYEIARTVESIRNRQDALVDMALDSAAHDEIVAQILTKFGEHRIALVEKLMRDAAPDWAALADESKQELIAAELEYRAYVAGERTEVHPAAVANLYYRAIEREMDHLPGVGSPPQWIMFKDERGYADHADQFDEMALTRMRGYLFGLYRHKDALLPFVARAARRRRKNESAGRRPI
jgi:hypothetical protein